MYKSNVLNNNSGLYQHVKIFITVIMFKNVKVLNKFGSCPLYFLSPKVVKWPLPCGSVVWQAGFFSVALLLF
jgi:hypothetical protein